MDDIDIETLLEMRDGLERLERLAERMKGRTRSFAHRMCKQNGRTT